MEDLTKNFHFPTGMLDRDQRTAMTAKKIINIKSYNNLNIYCDKIFYLNNNELNNLNNKNKRNKIYRVPKSCQKVSNYLLICFYFWIYSVHIISAAPIMENNHDYKPWSDYYAPELTPNELRELRLYLLGLRDACVNAYENATNNLNEYLRIISSANNTLDSEQFHLEWKHKQEPWLYKDKSSTIYYNNGFYHKHELPIEHVQRIKLFDVNKKEKLTEFIKEIYIRFSRLRYALNYVRNQYTANEAIQRIIEPLLNKTNEIIQEPRELLKDLNQQLPEIMDDLEENIENKSKLLHEWIIYRELLNQLSFDKKTLNILIEIVESVMYARGVSLEFN